MAYVDTAPRLPLNVYLLMMSQAFAGALPPIMVSLGGLIGAMLAPSPYLVTLPVSMFMVGTCVATIPAALLYGRFGRQPVYIAGALIAVTGALTCAWGVYTGSFFLLCFGALLFGLNIACVQSYRFAAQQGVPSSFRARAVSMVLLGGIGSAVIGPQIAIHSNDMIIGAPYVAAFLGQAMLAAITLPFLAGLRLPKTPVAQPATPLPRGRYGLPPLTRAYVIAVICGAFAYGSMTFTMTAAPLAMIACGFTEADAALGIQWHIIGMFAPSFVSGRLIDRYGYRPVMVAGIVFVVAGAILALSGEALANFWGTLILLGVGWNFAYTGSTVMIAKASAAAGSVALQGLADFMIFAFVAAASLLAGVLFQLSGWAVLNITVLVALGLILGLVTLDSRSARRAA
ncbi:MFS transporter [Rhodobacter sp. NTK016B]|uniref:MFS transporter n=2 Tax=Bacteria TaxID=2 RepID=UPI001A8E0864|nr:MFS transporter [Rhodobacter sp. NTK016B]MBN8294824.1 MFS transporter [Rhodobacter sp. NTK016B]